MNFNLGTAMTRRELVLNLFYIASGLETEANDDFRLRFTTKKRYALDIRKLTTKN